jgi:DNA-binding transcriptional ArsR family regulator
MVERSEQLDDVFASLGDQTRRNILMRIAKRSMNIGQIAQPYPISFAAVAKHVDVLVRAHLVTKTRQGKEQIIALNPATLAAADNYLEQYRHMWEQRLDSLDHYLKKTETKGKKR